MVSAGQDGWKYTLESIGRYFERVLSLPQDTPAPAAAAMHLVAMVSQEIPALPREMIGSYLQDAELLGQRTAEMHIALSQVNEPAFTPEPFTPFYQRSLFQQMRARGREALHQLRAKLETLPPDVRAEAEVLLAREGDIVRRFDRIRSTKITAQRIRCHGDFHLGQVLYTGKDFTLIDFEGEPGRPLSERRIKRAPVKDIAGMLRSFSYAPFAAILGQAQGVNVREKDRGAVEAWARFWQAWVSVAFLKGYLSHAQSLSALPKDLRQLEVLLDAYLLDKALYEMIYELSARPQWARIPMLGVRDILSETR
jgi:maltose alpha-D-glucosyltransferase/alpha-amylase